jgi:hypothetical protein
MSNDTPRDDAADNRPEEPDELVPGPFSDAQHGSSAATPAEGTEPVATTDGDAESSPGDSAVSATSADDVEALDPEDSEQAAASTPSADAAEAQEVREPEKAGAAEDETAAVSSAGDAPAVDGADKAVEATDADSDPKAAEAAEGDAASGIAAQTKPQDEDAPAKHEDGDPVAKDAKALARQRKREQAKEAAERKAAEKREARRQAAEPQGRAKGSRLKAAVGITGGAVLVAAVAAAAVAPKFIPTTDRHHLAVPSVRSGAGTTTYVCPPSPQRVGDDVSSDEAYSAGAQTAASSLSVLAQGDRAQRIPGTEVLAKDRTVKKLSKDVKDADKGDVVRGTDGYSGVKGVTNQKLDIADSAWMQVQPLGGVPSPAAGIRTIQQGSGDLTGFAAAPCSTTSNTVWLTGATTTLGHTAVLSVTNPSATPAGITATVYTKDGETTTGGIQPFTLKPGETRSFNLGGTAVEAKASSVKVESSGAAVSASVNQTIMRGTTPGGIDTITGGTADTVQVMTGVRTQGAKKSKSLGSSGDTGAETPQVQIADASGSGTQTSVVATDSHGKRKVIKENAEVPADSVLDVDLSSLPKGTWTIQVGASEPVVATTRMMKGDDTKSARDVAYAVATPSLSTDQVVALPTKGHAELDFTSVKGKGSVTAVAVKKDGSLGKSHKIEVGQGKIATLDADDLDDAVGVRLSGLAGTVYASMTTTGPKSGLGSSAIQQLPQAPASTRVDVGP